MRPRTQSHHLSAQNRLSDVVRKRVLALASAGAGGDLQPLLALVSQLHKRGHRVLLFGGREVASAVSGVGIGTLASRPELDLGPRFIAMRQETMSLPVQEQGREVGKRLGGWGLEVAADLEKVVREERPDILVSSLFGALAAGVVAQSGGPPWVAVNSTFYFGVRPGWPLDKDFAPRTLVLFREFLLPSLAGAALVLHATDQHFDFDFQELPPGHHYVGPLLWEPVEPAPGYLEEPGLPWVLIALSSDPQDDLPIARMTLSTLASASARVLATIGEGHDAKDLEPIPENARVEHHVPHGPVLERAVLMIGHAGHGSVMKALWRGVPMVLIPWARDQPGVARRAERLGVSRVVRKDDLSGDSLSEAIREVIADNSYGLRAAEEARRLQAVDAAGRACQLVEQL